MASGITKWGASYILNCFFGGQSTRPTSFYVALLTQTPGEHADGTLLSEPSPEVGYVRVELANDALSWGTADAGVVAATAQVVYPLASTDWPVITGYALCDSVVGGNVYLYGDFIVPRKVATGDVARIGPGSLNITVGSLSTQLSSTF